MMYNNKRRINRQKFTSQNPINKNTNTGVNQNTGNNNSKITVVSDNNNSNNINSNNTSGNVTNNLPVKESNNSPKLNRYQTKHRVLLFNEEGTPLNNLANYLKISPTNLYGTKIDSKLKLAILYFRNKQLADNCINKNLNLAICHQTTVTEFKYIIKLEINEENIKKVWTEFSNPENHYDSMTDESEKTITRIVSMNMVTNTKYWSIHTNNLISEKLVTKLELTRDTEKTVSFILGVGENINIRHDEMEKTIEEQWKIKPKVSFSNDKKFMYAVVPTGQLKTATITREIYFADHIFKNLSYGYYKKKSYKIKFKQMEEDLKNRIEENEVITERLNTLEDNFETFKNNIKVDFETRIRNLESESVTKEMLKEEIQANNTSITLELGKHKVEMKDAVNQQLQINASSLMEQVNYTLNQNFARILQQLEGIGVNMKPNK